MGTRRAADAAYDCYGQAMSRPRAYGDAVARGLGLEVKAPLVSGSLRSARIGISRISCQLEHLGMTPAIPAEEAFALGVYLTALDHHEIWSRGRRLTQSSIPAWSMTLANLVGEYSANILCPHEVIVFYIPKRALDELTEEMAVPRIGGLASVFGEADRITSALASCLLPALERPGEASSLFVDQVTIALCVHLIERYGGLEPARSLAKNGGLTSSQAKRAKGILADRLDADLTIGELAAICGMSRGHLARAFKVTVGITPHQWRQQYRIDVAKAMLKAVAVPIADIALKCGFADQSHLSRVFKRLTGESPASWRTRWRN